MPKFGQVLGTECENLSAWRGLIYFWRRGGSKIPTSYLLMCTLMTEISDVSYMQAILNIQ